MKKLLSTALALTLLLSLLAGCGTTATVTSPSPSPSTSAAADAPDSEQYINAVLGAETSSSEPASLDAVRFNNLVDRTILWNTLEPLTRIEDGALVPAGAESWDISEDGLVYTFHLRENYWSDGQKVTAQDYAYTIEREADPAYAFAFASDIYCIKNFEARFNGDAGAGELGVKVLDESTLELTLDYASPSLLTTFDFFPQRQDYVEKSGDKYGSEAETVISCGPFTLTSWVHNTQLTLEKNDQYWDADNVYLQKINYLIISDISAQFASLENGSVDFLPVSDADYIAKFGQNSAMTGTFVDSGRTSMFVFNCADSVFKNTKIRQAFSLAVDREGISKDLNNDLTKPAYALIPSSSSVGSANYRDAVPEPLLALKEQNPDPKALLVEGLEEAGLGSDPSALKVTLNLGATNAATKTQGEFYQQMLQNALGVTVELAFNDKATHFALIDEGKYQIGVIGWGANIEPQFQMTRWVDGGQAHWSNDAYDALVTAATTALDEKERLELYAQAETLLITEAPIAPIAYLGYIQFKHNYIRGLSTNSFDTTGMKAVYTVGR